MPALPPERPSNNDCSNSFGQPRNHFVRERPVFLKRKRTKDQELRRDADKLPNIIVNDILTGSHGSLGLVLRAVPRLRCCSRACAIANRYETRPNVPALAQEWRQAPLTRHGVLPKQDKPPPPHSELEPSTGPFYMKWSHDNPSNRRINAF